MSFLARSFVQTFNTQIEIYLELNFRKSSVAEKAFYEVLVLAGKMVYHISSPLIRKTIFFDHFFVTNEFGCLNFSYLAFLKVNILLILLNHIEKVSELFRYISESVSMKLLSKKKEELFYRFLCLFNVTLFNSIIFQFDSCYGFLFFKSLSFFWVYEKLENWFCWKLSVLLSSTLTLNTFWILVCFCFRL